MLTLAITIKAHTGIRLAEVGEAVGAIGGLALLVGGLTPFGRRAGEIVGGLAIAIGFVCLVLAEVELEVERMPAAGEVLVELPPHAVECLRSAQDPRSELAREPLELRLRLGIEADAAEAALGDADEQRSHRRVVENVVGHIEGAGRGRRRAEAFVENGRDSGHRCSFSFRSRRTPAEAACRAACSFEPSAAPIAS